MECARVQSVITCGGRTIHIYLYIYRYRQLSRCTDEVGLAQARPNKCTVYICVCVYSVLCVYVVCVQGRCKRSGWSGFGGKWGVFMP